MSWTEYDTCSEETFIRYLSVMHLYVDGASPQWFKKKFDFAPTTIHTIVSNVRNWMVSKYPDESICKPGEMNDTPARYHELLNKLETLRTNKPPVSPTTYAAIFTRKRTFSYRKGSVHAPKHVKVLGLPTNSGKTSSSDKASKSNNAVDVVEHLLTAASEISEGNIGSVTGAILIAVTKNGPRFSKVSVSDIDVHKNARLLMESIKVSVPSVFDN